MSPDGLGSSMPRLSTTYGELLAGVDLVIVGAGIPLAIPGILDRLSRGEAGELELDVSGGSNGSDHAVSSDPNDVMDDPPDVERPLFFPIVSSNTLATVMVRKSKGGVDGLIIEAPTAGGHNAPPRGKTKLDEDGEPAYGPRDAVDLAPMERTSRPW